MQEIYFKGVKKVNFGDIVEVNDVKMPVTYKLIYLNPDMFEIINYKSIKTPILTTHDGVDIYDEYKILYGVSNKCSNLGHLILHDTIADIDIISHYDNKWFSTQEARNEWVRKYNETKLKFDDCDYVKCIKYYNHNHIIESNKCYSVPYIIRNSFLSKTSYLKGNTYDFEKISKEDYYESLRDYYYRIVNPYDNFYPMDMIAFRMLKAIADDLNGDWKHNIFEFCFLIGESRRYHKTKNPSITDIPFKREEYVYEAIEIMGDYLRYINNPCDE